jgi:FAD/FMN-containing dehydrogenase
MSALDTLIARLGDMPVLTAEKAVKAKSRDFFWYSPILKQKIDHVTADAVVAPRSEAEVVQVLAACYDLGIPVTPRGGGTGNYGQAMPLAGGVVLDMTRMNRVIDIAPGRIICEPGALMGDLEAETRKTGQEFRMHPSTRETASIGGFISGGSGGVGSIHWGMLWEPGNILRVRIATLEATPRLIDLTGTAINQVHHAYGVTGVITEVEMPLAPAEDWVEMLVSFDTWQTCVEAGWDLCCQSGLLLKELAAIEGPAPHRYFTRYRPFLREGDSVLAIMAAPMAMVPLVERVEGQGGRVAFRSDTAGDEAKKGLPHLHHLCWNHTTLRALKAEPEITYMQLGARADDVVGSILDVARLVPDEIMNHVEFTHSQGVPRASMLPMLRYSTKPRFDEIVALLAERGIIHWNPHAYTLEEGNYRGPDPAQVAMKRAHDPKGLLNPGKLIGWDAPDYVYDPRGDWDWPGMRTTP